MDYFGDISPERIREVLEKADFIERELDEDDQPRKVLRLLQKKRKEQLQMDKDSNFVTEKFDIFFSLFIAST